MDSEVFVMGLRREVHKAMSSLQCIAACLVLHPHDALRVHAHAYDEGRHGEDNVQGLRSKSMG